MLEYFTRLVGGNDIESRMPVAARGRRHFDGMLLFVGQRNGDAVPFVFACLDFFAVYLEYVLGITATAALRRNSEYEIIGKQIALDGIMGAVT